MSKDFTDEFFEDEEGAAEAQEVTAQEPESDPDKDLVAPEDAPEPEQAATADADGDDDAPGEPEPDGDASPVTRGQLAALMSEREKRQAIERELEEHRRKLADFEAEREKRQREQQQQQTQKPLPDPFDDPKGYSAYMAETVQSQVLNTKLDLSEVYARGKFGDESVDAMQAWYKQEVAKSPHLAQDVVSQKDPYSYAMKIYNRSKMVEEIGDDPDAYRQRLEAELLEKLNKQPIAVADPAKPKASPPPSLAKGGAGGASEQPVSDEEFFTSVFKR